jgi:hypothetical protein
MEQPTVLNSLFNNLAGVQPENCEAAVPQRITPTIGCGGEVFQPWEVKFHKCNTLNAPTASPAVVALGLLYYAAAYLSVERRQGHAAKDRNQSSQC